MRAVHPRRDANHLDRARERKREPGVNKQSTALTACLQRDLETTSIIRHAVTLVHTRAPRTDIYAD